MKRLTYSNSMQKRRHRHKLILPLWCILLLVTGCGNLYTGDESLYDPNHQDNQGDQTQLPVMVAFSDPIYNVLTAVWTKSPPKNARHWDSPPSNANCTANGRLMQETARSLTGKVPATSPITICRKNSTPSTSLFITTTMRKWAK